ncbi:hypothetical protein [Carboxylicivirga caseinilyticus]|uniref:hypothetical protein n=1 Tax=Carboxylicivirga caseinilyticus TaxID=3417572 RepID=UPI003D347676|nr:hypothetical protein [Marinilabiliaceae bacterium A049]
MIDFILKQLNNRDLAILTWLAILLCSVFLIKFIRKHAIAITKVLFSSVFITIFQLTICYLLIIIWGLINVDFWNIHLLKGTIFWFFGVGIIMTFKAIGKDIPFFRKIFINAIKLTIIIGFVSNLHVFKYWIEFISIPILAMTGILMSINEYKTKDKRVDSFLNLIVILYSLSVISYAIYQTYLNYKNDFILANLQSLLLPSILTILFIPLSYFICIYSAYESLFCRLYNVNNKKYSRTYIKFRLVLKMGLNLNKIRIGSANLSPYYINETTNISSYLKEIIKPKVD